MRTPKAKKRTKVGDLFALGSTVTLVPVLAARFRKARRNGDRLELADAALSAAALTLGLAKYFRKQQPDDAAVVAEKAG